MLFFYSGAFHLFRFINNILGKRLTIITYHRVTDGNVFEKGASLPFLFTSIGTFEKQLKFVKKWYRVITFEELRQYIAKKKLPWNCIIITFDDGYEDNYLIAYPILKKKNLKATFFVTTHRIGQVQSNAFWWDRAYYLFSRLEKKSNQGLHSQTDREVLALIKEFSESPSKLFHRLNKLQTEEIEKWLNWIQHFYQIDEEPVLRENEMLTWEQCIELGREMEIGSHTCSHHNLVELDIDKKTFEIRESGRLLEKYLNRRIFAFSYPGGNNGESLTEIVRNAGYEFAVTSSPGINNMKDCYSLKRINVWEGTGLFMDGRLSKGYFAYKLFGL
jgi:peptidoglycan/xylan/chitin deacetylase (PgdA/CDA1 family)